MRSLLSGGPAKLGLQHGEIDEGSFLREALRESYFRILHKNDMENADGLSNLREPHLRESWQQNQDSFWRFEHESKCSTSIPTTCL